MKLLLVEDNEADEALLLRELKRGGWDVDCRRVDTEEELRRALAEPGWDLVISDYTMPTFSGTKALAVLRESEIDLPFIFVSGTLGEDVAVEAMRNGAADYITKGGMKRLLPAVDRELREAGERRRLRRAEAALRSTEEQLRRSQKLEAVGRLAAGVAHDFNNLLTVLMGYLSLLRDPETESGVRDAGLAEMERCVDRATGLTRQLLALGRRHPQERRPLDLNDVARDVEKLVRRLLGKDIELVCRLDADLPEVRADPGQVEQVLLNLLINARDAMPAGGRLELSTGVEELDAARLASNPEARPGRFVRLGVKDEGTGMGPEVLSHIFEPFFTTKGEGKGTGLGLAMVYGIVHQHLGHVEVDTAPGRGTTFRIYLPESHGAPAALPPRVQTADLPGGGETVLLVEDEAALRGLFALTLQRAGYQVLEAADGLEALEKAAAHRGALHLLVTDLGLPKLDGRELAKRLRARRPGLKVVYMTGYPDGAPREGEAGEEVLPKPLSVSAFLTKVREVLS